MEDKVAAIDQPVAILRKIHHWPLLLRDKVCEPWLDPAWTLVDDPLTLLGDDPASQQWAVQEFNYFHDTIQRFLYDPESQAFKLYRRNDIAEIVVETGERTHCLSVERLTLHVFGTKPRVAVLTLETLHQGFGGGQPLNLADVQTLIDHMRRSYVPFWKGRDPARCSDSVTLIRTDQNGLHYPISANPAQSPDAAFKAIQNDRGNDAPLFDHWREIAGLRLNGGEHPCQWRDPSDERIPVMSFIALSSRSSEPPRETMLGIDDADWLRIADAEEKGTGWPYNREFLKPAEEGAYYDRFYPDANQDENVATRHIFGGAHYSLVTVTDLATKGFDFARDVAQAQFRRHYAQMSLIARLEMTMLLGFSREVAQAAHALQGQKRDDNDFATAIIKWHGYFLVFVNRFRFTGVSSQIQGQEMFDRWRKSLGLERLFDDVRAELDATASYVRTEQEKRRADSADCLNFIALWIAVIALVTGAMATPLWGMWIRRSAGCGMGETDTHCAFVAEWWGAFLLILFIFALVFLIWVRRRLCGPGIGNQRK